MGFGIFYSKKFVVFLASVAVLVAAVVVIARRSPAPPLRESPVDTPPIAAEATTSDKHGAGAAATKSRILEYNGQTGQATELPTDANTERIRAALSGMTVQLSPDERELLEQIPPEKWTQALVDAERAYRNADDSDRDELNRRYLMLLNLDAKLAERPPPVSKEAIELDQRYERALQQHRAEIEKLEQRDPEQAEQLRATLKQQIYKDAPSTDTGALRDR
jgi:hypothetical protein